MLCFINFYTYLQFTLNDPEVPPAIHCLTRIYHPNIDPTITETDVSNICVNLLDDWSESNDLEDCVQALLFLFHNPNIEDPLSPYFDPSGTYEDFQENVLLSLEGKEVDEIAFETNYGYIENGIVEKKVIEEESGVLQIDKLSKMENSTDQENCTPQTGSNLILTNESTQIVETKKNQDHDNNVDLTSEQPIELISNGQKEKYPPPIRLEFGNVFLDSLVPFNTLVSVVFKHFLKKFKKSK